MARVIIKRHGSSPTSLALAHALDPSIHAVQPEKFDITDMCRIFGNLMEHLVEQRVLTLEEAGLVIESWPMAWSEEQS